MAETNHSNISSAAVNGDIEKCTRPSPNSFGPSRLHNEPANQNCTDTSNFVDQVSQFSDDIAVNSTAEKLESSDAILIRNNRCKNSSYLNRITPEQTHGSVHTRVSEQKHEPIRRAASISKLDEDQSLVCSNDVNQDYLARALELPLDMNRNSQIDDKGLSADEGCTTEDIESIKKLTQKPSPGERTEVQQNILQEIQVEVSKELLSKLSEKNHLNVSEFSQNNPAGSDVIEEFGPHLADCSLDDVLKLSVLDASNSDNRFKSFDEGSINELKTPIKRTTKYTKQVNCQVSKSRRKKYILRSLGHTDRVLRPRTKGNATASKPSNPVSCVRPGGNGKSRKNERRKKNKASLPEKEKVADKFSKIRNCLRYLLNRMAYEQSFIAAYSGEGWKGYSLEKLKPEKELLRASSEIMRRKLKIRDLFKHLDSLCVSGRFPESLFDSEGQIDSEDIFCAICGSKEMSAMNDIILCDGECDRGFHQLCLDPPLLNEDIPPDDDGWLCPGCDCKVDCIDLLNDAQGTNYSLTDSWENIYPEAAVVAAGQSHNLTLGLPSDDSDDNDFDPDEPETDEHGAESSPVVTDNNIKSENLVASPKNNQYLGVPSDDSEDDDYIPGAPDTEEKLKSESSSSDFTSDSEILAAIVEDDRPSRNQDDSVSSYDNGTSSHVCIDKKSCRSGLGERLLNDELSSLLNSEPLNDRLSPIASRRQVERLDYKKLHDETYGHISSDSSDDDDWNDTAAPEKKSFRIVSPAEQIGNSSVVKKKGHKVMGENYVKGGEITPKRSAHHRQTDEVTNDSSIKVQEGSSKSCSTARRAKSSAYHKLGEAVIQRLRLSFGENQYPEKHAKESLAQDLGLSLKQVSKWFENTRWSTRHPTNAKANRNTNIDKSESPPKKVTPVSPTRELEPESDPSLGDTTHNSAHLIQSPKASVVIPQCLSGDTKDGILVSHKSTKQEPNSTKSRKRKGRSGDLAIDIDVSTIETLKPLAQSSDAREGRASDRIRTRKQKMIASDTDFSTVETRKLRSGSKKADEDQENHLIRKRRQKSKA